MWVRTPWAADLLRPMDQLRLPGNGIRHVEGGGR